MKDDEITERDFHLMTAKFIMHNAAMLRTLIQTNMIIIELLQGDKKEKLNMDKMNEWIEKNNEIIERAFKEDIPLYDKMKFPLKNV